MAFKAQEARDCWWPSASEHNLFKREKSDNGKQSQE